MQRKEAVEILGSIEEEYRQDLAVHLYSTFLLHEINPNFPQKKWSAWPLPKNDVPDPGHSRKYADAIADDEYQNNQKLVEAELKLFGLRHSLTHPLTPTERRELASQSLKIKGVNEMLDDWYGFDSDSDADSVSSDSESEDSGSSTTRLENVDDLNSKKPTVNSVEMSESITNPRATLLNEIHLLVQRKIHDHYIAEKNHNKFPELDRSKVIPTAEFDVKAATELSKRIANKTSNFVDLLLLIDTRAKKMTRKRIANKHLFNWQDVLLTNLHMDEADRGSTTNTAKHRHIYDRAEKFFVGVKYNYELDDPDTSSEGPTPKFNINDNLDQFYHDSELINRETMLRRMKDRTELIALNKKLFMNKLRVQERLNLLSWDENSVQTYKKSRYNEIMKDEGVTLNEEEQEAFEKFIPKKYKKQVPFVVANDYMRRERTSAIGSSGPLQMSAEDFVANL